MSRLVFGKDLASHAASLVCGGRQGTREAGFLSGRIQIEHI